MLAFGRLASRSSEWRPRPSVTLEFAATEIDRNARAWLDRLGDRPLSYTDATGFALIEALGCDFALTFDGDFAAAGIARWK